ncbi:hypothetical protein V2J56_09030 [Georgenia sp. MJ206]|uniref:hypothetical protein n=1 Tax=Georgenia wangjunii TaxID=3117730 RepID=UPI002F268C89
MNTQTCRYRPRAATPSRHWPARCGDIGEPEKHIELEPFPESVPEVEPAPGPAEPVREPEPVPA